MDTKERLVFLVSSVSFVWHQLWALKTTLGENVHVWRGR